MTDSHSTGQTGGATNPSDSGSTLDHARDVASDAARRASEGLDRTRDVASEATRRASEGLESNPLGILVGGLAVGALAGSLIPRSAKEKELLAPVGQKLGASARAAIAAAKDAGQNELQTRGFTADAGREQVQNLLGGLGKALSTAGSAAVDAARGSSAGSEPSAPANGGTLGGV